MADNHHVAVEELQREVEELRRQLATGRTVRAARVRSVLTWVLTVLAVLATTLALLAMWTFRTLTDTERFVDRVGAVIEEPEVAAAVGDAAASQVVEALALEDRLREALPDDVVIAAGPISNAAESYLARGATRLAQTDAFRAAWDAGLASGHRLSIAILSGTDTTVVQNTDGVIVLDITPVINLLLADGSEFISDLIGRDVSAPTVTAETIEAAVAALEDQLGTDLPADFGRVTLIASDDLAAAQAAYQTVRLTVWLSPIAAAVLVGLAIAASTRRLRTTMSIVVGTGLLVVAVGVALQPLRASIVASVESEGLAPAVAAAFDTVLGSLRTGIVLVVVLAVVAAAVLFLTGKSSAAASGRQLVAQVPRSAAAHRGWFLGGGAVVVLLLLAALPDRTWGQLLVGLLLYAVYALAVLLAPGATAIAASRGSPSPEAADMTRDDATVL